MCLLSNNIHDYYFISQGKTTIPNVDDGEEFRITDVSFLHGFGLLYVERFNKLTAFDGDSFSQHRVLERSANYQLYFSSVVYIGSTVQRLVVLLKIERLK